MSPVRFTEELAREYEGIFAGAAIRPERLSEARAGAGRLAAGERWSRYREVEARTGVPAHVVGILHSLECGGSFAGHLHNGDPLSGRTVRVPAGRPVRGVPPFAWEDSAADALRLQGLDRWRDWSVAGVAYVLERYNGFGYRNRRPPMPSPYLWSFTTAYASGKYVADGRWSATAVSRQCGGMALLRLLVEMGRVRLPDGGRDASGKPDVVPAAEEAARPA
uniref:Lysozyme family protein n=1 Tax=Desulfovibrio sp. U5L TaxID=596152 RepID=I2PY33_9BACT